MSYPNPVQPPTNLPRRGPPKIPGNVLAGFLKDHQVSLCLGLPEDLTKSWAWIAALLSRIATTEQVATFNAQFSHARHQSEGTTPRISRSAPSPRARRYPSILLRRPNA